MSSDINRYRFKVRQARRQYWSGVEDAAARISELLEVLQGDAQLSGRPVGLGLPGASLDALSRLFGAGTAFRTYLLGARRPELPSLFSKGLVG